MPSRGEAFPCTANRAIPRPSRSPTWPTADIVVALKEAEHRGMMAQQFPLWQDRIEYWHVDDLDCAQAHEALPYLEEQIHALVERLRAADGHDGANGHAVQRAG